jgi:uncharacterized protein YutE (UPF0331/DUF86 family)
MWMRSAAARQFGKFTGDRRGTGAAESCLRRALEALLDLGRHLLAKVFGEAVRDQTDRQELGQRKVLAPESAHRLRVLAGYRNRMVHFYQDVTEAELYSICTRDIEDLLAVRDAFSKWLKDHPESIDTSL